MIIFYSFLVLFAAIFFEHFVKLKKHDWIRRFPGPNTTLPVLGDALQFLGHPSTLRTKYRLNFHKYGSTWRFWFMSKPSLVTADPNLAKELLGSVNHLEKHFIYENSAKLIFREYGLVTSPVHQWKNDRKIFNKVFNHDLLELSFNLSVKNWKEISQELLSDKERRPIKCRKLFRKHFLATFLMSNGIDDGTLISEEMRNNLCEAFDVALDLLNQGIMKPWTMNPVFWKLSGNQSKYSHVYDFISSFSKRIITHLVLKNENKEGICSGEHTEHPHDKLKQVSQSLPKLLIDPSIPLNWKVDHLITLAAAGTDTTAVTASMTLFFLALNPESQRRAQEEVDALFESNESLRFGDISKLKYLRMCLKEAMRLHAPVPLIGRTTTEAILLEDGRKIPEGASIIVLLDEMNMSPKYFPDPLKFHPERFNPTNVKDIPPGAFIPFSTGPRNCIGYKYSECVLIPLLALTLRHFTVHTNQRAQDIQLLYEVAGTPYPEVEIMFRKRSI